LVSVDGGVIVGGLACSDEFRARVAASGRSTKHSELSICVKSGKKHHKPGPGLLPDAPLLYEVWQYIVAIGLPLDLPSFLSQPEITRIEGGRKKERGVSP